MLVCIQRIAVLVVEDDALLRLCTVDDLADDGFEVFEAANAFDAINVLKAHPSLHLMFTDINMPGTMNGLALAEQVRNQWPPVKIIITSGHHRLGAKDMPVEGLFIRKPYLPEQVVKSIRELVAQ